MTHAAATPAANTSPDVGFAQSALGEALLGVLSDGSASQRTIADFVLRNPMRVTALGIEEIAEASAVSTATVSRFARDLGFRNFAAMRAAVAETLQAVLQPVDKLRHQIARQSAAAAPALESLDHASSNIIGSGKALDARELTRVVARLTAARTVYVLGFGLSVHLAGMLAMHLQPFCAQVVEVASQGGTEVAAAHLAGITGKDVLVVLSFPRYALDVVRLTQFARDRGATIVSITDAPASPLAELGHHVLYAHSAHPVLPSSGAAAVAVIEALAVSLMVSHQDNVDKAARLTEAIAAYLVGATPVSNSSKGGARKRRPSKTT
ncbi:MurR/RpiR family transcriptional regulator [Massilia arenosa]|uniref:MurR/RpiR family transcriptional regulator n=1 Tax=Zemynaea arenosa TaxID=2561931 RepID=A0A4Y9SFV2_9BURK|nr:MurR/RpiR family transcriptional regulator [Massilia arenosa]TFW20063.1 MurR/RpiR family transcriptional regulator [Massilia arenosa]